MPAWKRPHVSTYDASMMDARKWLHFLAPYALEIRRNRMWHITGDKMESEEEWLVNAFTYSGGNMCIKGVSDRWKNAMQDYFALHESGNQWVISVHGHPDEPVKESRFKTNVLKGDAESILNWFEFSMHPCSWDLACACEALNMLSLDPPKLMRELPGHVFKPEVKLSLRQGGEMQARVHLPIKKNGGKELLCELELSANYSPDDLFHGGDAGKQKKESQLILRRLDTDAIPEASQDGHPAVLLTPNLHCDLELLPERRRVLKLNVPQAGQAWLLPAQVQQWASAALCVGIKAADVNPLVQKENGGQVREIFSSIASSIRCRQDIEFIDTPDAGAGTDVDTDTGPNANMETGNVADTDKPVQEVALWDADAVAASIICSFDHAIKANALESMEEMRDRLEGHEQYIKEAQNFEPPGLRALLLCLIMKVSIPQMLWGQADKQQTRRMDDILVGCARKLDVLGRQLSGLVFSEMFFDGDSRARYHLRNNPVFDYLQNNPRLLHLIVREIWRKSNGPQTKSKMLAALFGWYSDEHMNISPQWLQEHILRPIEGKPDEWDRESSVQNENNLEALFEGAIKAASNEALYSDKERRMLENMRHLVITNKRAGSVMKEFLEHLEPGHAADASQKKFPVQSGVHEETRQARRI